MSVKMRAKLVISNVQRYKDNDDKTTSERITFRAVCKEDGYGTDGADENNTYAMYSPSFDAALALANPALFDTFKSGDTFYVDFTPVEA